MRVLHVDKFMRRYGGAAAYMLELAELQRRAGHQPEFFAMADERNLPARYASDFAPHIQFEPPPAGLGARVAGAARLVYSRPAEAAMARVIGDFQPDVVHLHTIYHQLTPSILRPLVRAGIPVVMTVHDSKLVCPSYQLLDRNGPCTACLDGHFRHAVQRRCKDGSLGLSSLLALESRVHRTLQSYGAVGAFVCPSNFMLDLLSEADVFPDRLHHVPHFVDVDSMHPRVGAGEGIVYAGRLSHQKGVDVLIRAVASMPDATLTVVGDGPERTRLQELAGRLAPGQVTFTGQLDRDATMAQFRAARLAVLPTRGYENQPMSVLEAMACAVPAVVTDLGGAPELVSEGVTGRIVPVGDVAALGAAVGELLHDPDAAVAMGRAARDWVRHWHEPARHLDALDRVYAVAARHRKS